jgi:hypothetical protein
MEHGIIILIPSKISESSKLHQVAIFQTTSMLSSDMKYLLHFSDITFRFSYHSGDTKTLKMSVLTPKKCGEFISEVAKNVFIIPDGVKKLAHEVSSGRN